jgi:hypothetical protein
MKYKKLVLCVVLVSSSIWGMDRAKAKLKADSLIEKYCDQKRKNRCEEKDILIYILRQPKITIDECLVREFIRRGIDINAINNERWTALASASWCRNDEALCNVLFDCGADSERALNTLLIQHPLYPESINDTMYFCGRVCLNTYRKHLMMAYLLSLKRLGIWLPKEIHGRILSYSIEIMPSYCFWKLYPEKEVDKFFDFHNDEVKKLFNESAEWPN